MLLKHHSDKYYSDKLVIHKHNFQQTRLTLVLLSVAATLVTGREDTFPVFHSTHRLSLGLCFIINVPQIQWSVEQSNGTRASSRNKQATCLLKSLATGRSGNDPTPQVCEQEESEILFQNFSKSSVISSNFVRIWRQSLRQRQSWI